ncbi:hypothetical protein [Amylibacter marinus]|nr:hypothetical protein [Amylibacter marinus]
MERPSFVPINPQETLDWILGLRIGVDWSKGTKCFNYPLVYIVGEDEFRIHSAGEHQVLYEIMGSIVELKDVDILGGQAISYEVVDSENGLLRLEWNVVQANQEPAAPTIAVYYLRPTDIGFRIEKIVMESFSTKDPIITALRVIKQVDGNIHAARELVRLIQM